MAFVDRVDGLSARLMGCFFFNICYVSCVGSSLLHSIIVFSINARGLTCLTQAQGTFAKDNFETTPMRLTKATSNLNLLTVLAFNNRTVR